MNKPFRNLLIIGILLLVCVSAFWLSHRSKSGSALAKYKAELRQKGEKITFAELGFPRAAETNRSIQLLTNAVKRIKGGAFEPGALATMQFTGPGRAQVSWSAPAAVLSGRYGRGTSNTLSWETVSAALDATRPALEEIRLACEHPPRFFQNDPANYPNVIHYPFVSMRNAAQWLMGDAVAALHANEQERAFRDVHALAQLVQFHRDDPTLVCQMIRVAIAGLGLSVTWEALQAGGWTESELGVIQRDWESANLIDGLEKAMLGERAFGDMFFAEIRNNGALRTNQKFSVASSNSKFRQRLESMFEAFVWKLNLGEEELLTFQEYQRGLEPVRNLEKNKPWPEIRASLQPVRGKVQGPPWLQKYRHPISSMLIPNYAKALQTTVRNETQRRLTVVAIALQRYELRHYRPPSSLQELVPEFFSAVPIDPMSGEPLRYRLNPDGSFLLYSVGEDGKDDSGDANLSSPAKTFDLWSGKDAVWPAAWAGDK
jgi:hypothetical protein